ncbi:uncharacterized protein EV422DRAFT_529844 [Fimicolochytrium jonesii]|uniref:uncharacterized protein n=1 Tax=Fimicolochytrium jonesii TaxID=1396493 RepID=UPI0022FE0ED9|nr:uncharacterized protein EV422DRAFT_529844 [Fimicolochytrium jonesii]KAI8820708.1 hypothetical protein EV422DRAFT_529844 [Fimicolochytrium jonesii]
MDTRETEEPQETVWVEIDSPFRNDTLPPTMSPPAGSATPQGNGKRDRARTTTRPVGFLESARKFNVNNDGRVRCVVLPPTGSRGRSSAAGVNGENAPPSKRRKTSNAGDESSPGASENADSEARALNGKSGEKAGDKAGKTKKAVAKRVNGKTTEKAESTAKKDSKKEVKKVAGSSKGKGAATGKSKTTGKLDSKLTKSKKPPAPRKKKPIPIIAPPSTYPLDVHFPPAVFLMFLEVQQFLHRFSRLLKLSQPVIDALREPEWHGAHCTEIVTALLDVSGVRGGLAGVKYDPNSGTGTRRTTAKWSVVADLLANASSPAAGPDAYACVREIVAWEDELQSLRTLRTGNSVEIVPFIVRLTGIHTLVALFQTTCLDLIRAAVDDASKEHTETLRRIRAVQASIEKARADKLQAMAPGKGIKPVAKNTARQDKMIRDALERLKPLLVQSYAVLPSVSPLGRDAQANVYWFFPLHETRIYICGPLWPPIPADSKPTDASTPPPLEIVEGHGLPDFHPSWNWIPRGEAGGLVKFLRQQHKTLLTQSRASKSQQLQLLASPDQLETLIAGLEEIDTLYPVWDSGEGRRGSG